MKFKYFTQLASNRTLSLDFNNFQQQKLLIFFRYIFLYLYKIQNNLSYFFDRNKYNFNLIKKLYLKKTKVYSVIRSPHIFKKSQIKFFAQKKILEQNLDISKNYFLNKYFYILFFELYLIILSQENIKHSNLFKELKNIHIFI